MAYGPVENFSKMAIFRILRLLVQNRNSSIWLKIDSFGLSPHVRKLSHTCNHLEGSHATIMGTHPPWLRDYPHADNMSLRDILSIHTSPPHRSNKLELLWFQGSNVILTKSKWHPCELANILGEGTEPIRRNLREPKVSPERRSWKLKAKPKLKRSPKRLNWGNRNEAQTRKWRQTKCSLNVKPVSAMQTLQLTSYWEGPQCWNQARTAKANRFLQ